MAAVYDLVMRAPSRACLEDWRRELLQDVAGEVLEIGAGTGANVPHYPASVSRLVLSEPDPPMRAKLSARAERAGRRGRIEISSASASALPFPDGSFDVVVSTLVLCSVSDLDATLGEVRRVLRPTGRFVYLEHVAAEPHSSRLRFQTWIEPVWRKLAGNCHLTRRTGEAIRRAGFDVERETAADMRKALPIVRPTLRGVARLLALALSLAAFACGGGGRASATPSKPPAPRVVEGEQRLANLGTCVLENGGRIEDCRIGYRTYGRLDSSRSNVVLFPTWFSGTTKDLAERARDLVDTDRFHLVLVDALGNGVSSAPSNSKAQPRLAFPRFSIRDMVEMERRLLTEVLSVSHLHAVVGISMGGMQAFQWAVAHPDAMDHVVSIVGSPRLTSSDRLLWTSELHALESDVAYRGGDYEVRPKLRAVVDIHQLALTTPAHRSRETKTEDFARWIGALEDDTSFDWNDWRRQLEAMLAHDVGAAYGGLDQAAKRVRAKTLVVVAEQDHMVHPGPSLDFAQLCAAQVVRLRSDCGHAAPGCEPERVRADVRDFLTKSPERLRSRGSRDHPDAREHHAQR